MGLWRRHHHSNRPVHPPLVRQALARRLAVLARASDCYKLGGAPDPTPVLGQKLTRVDHGRIQGPWPGQPLRRRLRHVAHQAARAARARLWPCRQVRGPRYLRRHVQEQPPGHRVPLHHGHERRRQDALRQGQRRQGERGRWLLSTTPQPHQPERES